MKIQWRFPVGWSYTYMCSIFYPYPRCMVMLCIQEFRFEKIWVSALAFFLFFSMMFPWYLLYNVRFHIRWSASFFLSFSVLYGTCCHAVHSRVSKLFVEEIWVSPLAFVCSLIFMDFYIFYVIQLFMKRKIKNLHEYIWRLKCKYNHHFFCPNEISIKCFC